MQKNKKLSLIMLGLLVGTTAKADNSAIGYTYLSGGVAYDKSGWNKPLKEFFKAGSGAIGEGITHQNLTPKGSSLGSYLHGSYALDDNIFLDAKLRYLGGRKNGYFVGVGYHLAVNENSDFYVLGGISQPDLPAKVRLKLGKETLVRNAARAMFLKIMTMKPAECAEYIKKIDDNQVVILRKMMLETLPKLPRVDGDQTFGDFFTKQGYDNNDIVNTAADAAVDAVEKFNLPIQKTIDDSEISLKSQIAPTLEVGYRINFSEQLGARLAYRGSYDSVRMRGKFFNPINEKLTTIDCKSQGLSHEGTVEATYAFTPNLIAEAGYTISQMFKFDTIKPNISHQYTVGLRYVF